MAGKLKEQAFILEIIDTQGKSWQGRLKWVQGGKTQSFRSALELMNLLDSALQEETRDRDGEKGEPEGSAGEDAPGSAGIEPEVPKSSVARQNPQPEKGKRRRGRPRKKPEGAITGPGRRTV